jgi:hypothetical protein
MRTHIAAGKESQSSLINYAKGGKPFINLVTIVPIPWDTDEIAYFVGFQVDLVDQPNAILDRMKDGTYVVNYSLYNNPALSHPSDPTTVSMQSIELEGTGAGVGGDDRDWMAIEDKPTSTAAAANSAAATGGGDLAARSDWELLDVVENEGVEALDSEADKRAFHKLVLGEVLHFFYLGDLRGECGGPRRAELTIFCIDRPTTSFTS